MRLIRAELFLEMGLRALGADTQPTDAPSGPPATMIVSEQASPLPDRVVQFFQQEVAHLQKNVRSVHFQTLVPLIERAYDTAFAAVPKPLDRQRDLWSWQALGLCHRSFLVAASIIGRGHPDDAVGTTRRALEAAKAAFAITHDPENAREWMAYEQRMQRWKDRERDDSKPAPVRPKLKLPTDQALLNRVGKWIGMLSDTLHFTPEFVGNHDAERRPGEAFLHYFTMDGAEIDRALRTLATCHIHILEVFNEVFGGEFRRSGEWCAAMHAIGAAGDRLIASAGPQTETAE